MLLQSSILSSKNISFEKTGKMCNVVARVNGWMIRWQLLMTPFSFFHFNSNLCKSKDQDRLINLNKYIFPARCSKQDFTSHLHQHQTTLPTNNLIYHPPGMISTYFSIDCLLLIVLSKDEDPKILWPMEAQDFL